MSPQNTWICDGQPKDGKQYPNSGPHEPYENHGPDCLICGLPREAMTPGKKTTSQKTVVSKSPSSGFPILPILIVVLLLLLGGGFGLYRVLQGNRQPGIATDPGTQTSSPTTPPAAAPADPQAIVSETASNAQLISQGEKILISNTANNAEKTQAAAAFAQRSWDDAIAQYSQAVTADPNDPESKIYLNNAKAKKAGNSITMAVVVPIASSADAAKEVLRGVAQAQDEFNQSPPASGTVLEVVIVNDVNSLTSASLAQDLIKSPNVLAVLGHGVDNGSRQAVALYEQAGLTVLSPISTSITPSGAGQSTLKTITLAQKANELLSTYLQTVGATLAKHATSKVPAAPVVVFYNADSPYSEQLKQQFATALTQANGKVVQEVDVTAAGFDAAKEIAAAKTAGAKVAVMALSKNKVDQAVAIAQAAASGGTPLQLMGGDELYNPAILLQGGEAVKGIVLAVPWSSQPNDPFAQQASNIWKGRVSWRTATAYDATKALTTALSQNSTRTGVVQLLNQGVPISGTTTNFDVLSSVPLVQAVPGPNGPAGSKYQFDPI